MEWVLLTLVFGICKGFREGIKKKALEKSSTFEVLFLYTLLGFLLVIPTAKDVFSIPWQYYFFILIKAGLVFTAWTCSFNSIKYMPVSLYGVMDTSRVVFSTFMGVMFMSESLRLSQITGMILVISGLVLVNINQKSDTKVKSKYLFLTLVACLFNATSGVLDKWLTKTVSSGQLQFWFMLYLTVMYGLYILFTKTKVSVKTLKTNYWIVILAVIFVIGDRALFMANANPDSRITIMTLIKQSSVLAAILAGRIMFREKGTLRRVLCALLVVLGIVVATVF